MVFGAFVFVFNFGGFFFVIVLCWLRCSPMDDFKGF
jgi:hypothetical protein